MSRFQPVLYAGFVAAGFLAAEALHAQQSPQGVKRTPLQKTEVPGSAYETIMGVAEIPPGLAVGRHTHFGIELGYVIEGEGVLVMEGEAERPFKAGDSYRIPAGRAHDARATGDKSLKVLAVYVVEIGKPLVTPAP